MADSAGMQRGVIHVAETGREVCITGHGLTADDFRSLAVAAADVLVRLSALRRAADADVADPTAAVSALISAGWSEAAIASEVGASQPTIHRIKHGAQSVEFRMGMRIIRLAEMVASGELVQGESHAG